MVADPRFFLPRAFHIHYDGIDDEHEALVGIVNGFFALRESKGEKELSDQLGIFVKLLRSHFDNEEHHMAALGYPGLDWHRDHHADCLTRAEDLISESERRGRIDDDIIERCFEEVVQEVARADLKFGEFLKGRGLEDD